MGNPGTPFDNESRAEPTLPDGAEPAASGAPVLFAEATAAAAATASQPEPYAHLPEDLRVPWTWLDVLISVFFSIGSLVVTAYFLSILAGFWAAILPPVGREIVTRQAILQVVHTVLTFAFVLLFLAALIRFRYQRPFWRTVGFRIFRVGGLGAGWSGCVIFVFGMFLSVVIANFAQYVKPTGPIPIEQMTQAPTSAFFFLMAAIVVAPFAEEIFFRGWLYPVLGRSFGVTGGVLATGLLFGLLHGAQLGGHWQLISLLTFVGIALTWVRARTGSVLSSFLLHLGYNSLLVVGFLIGTSGLQNLPGAK